MQERVATNSSTSVTASHFAAAWAEASRIPGWLSEPEARHLFEAARQVPPGHCIVEVGAYQGKSTVLLSHTGRQVITIDRMRIGHDPENRITITEQDVETLRSRLARFPNIRWLRVDSDNCPLPTQPIGLLYVDGDHRYPQPCMNVARFRERLSADARIAFHDFGTFEGVTRSVRELEEQGVLEGGCVRDSMYIGRLGSAASACMNCDVSEPPPPVTDVTGFHLFALCHRFGRRGRAFAASLATQQDNPYQLCLTIFHCEPADASLILEGISHGPAPPELTLVRIAREGIMQRAMHFADANWNPKCSHVVFLDADLWFPPEFFRQYGPSLTSNTPGYWSCTVRNVPMAHAESLLERWQLVTENELMPLVDGVRHHGFHGRVGHFQCIPAGFAPYPPDEIQAVNRADETFSAQAIGLSADKREERRIGSVSAYHFDHPWRWSGTPDPL